MNSDIAFRSNARRNAMGPMRSVLMTPGGCFFRTKSDRVTGRRRRKQAGVRSWCGVERELRGTIIN
eukprot:COSAG06_NODE_874_length_11831_cov_217.383396_2_plen_66_part_00